MSGKKSSISVFGLGYVGLVTATCLANKGYRIFGVENNPKKCQLLTSGKLPLYEPGLSRLFKKVYKLRLFGVVNAMEAVQNTDISFICVGTPSQRDGKTELSYVKNTCEEIAKLIKHKQTVHTIVIRSTVPPGTIESILIPMLQKVSGKLEGKDFHVIMNPEFMREGTAIRDFLKPPFVVIGERLKKAGDLLANVYDFIEETPIIRTSIIGAETLKFVCNAYHALKVTFANEIGQFCRELNINSRQIMDIFCKDTKLNIAPTYLRPGLAYGGSCLPKDLRSLVSCARERGLELPMIEAISRSNQEQIHRTVEHIASFRCREIGLLGLSFKKGTDDLRESPILHIAEMLIGKGFKLLIYDEEVKLTRLIGANKQYLESKLAHISSLLTFSVRDLVRRSKLIIICKSIDNKANLEKLLSPRHIVLDLIGITTAKKNHYGLYW